MLNYAFGQCLKNEYVHRWTKWIDRRLALSGAAILRKMGENIE